MYFSDFYYRLELMTYKQDGKVRIQCFLQQKRYNSHKNKEFL